MLVLPQLVIFIFKDNDLTLKIIKCMSYSHADATYHNTLYPINVKIYFCNDEIVLPNLLPKALKIEH